MFTMPPKQSKCPKCENTSFELAVAAPKGSTVKMYFVQCDKCGSVVGVTDYTDTEGILLKMAEKLGLKI